MSDETLLGYFPGRTFYGKFLDPAMASDIKQSLSVLHSVRSAHFLLQNLSNYLNVSDDVAMKDALRILRILNEAEGMRVVFGEGYSDELNPEESVPQCHILRCEIELPKNYFLWMKDRVAAYQGAARFFPCVPVLFLNMTNRIILEEGNNGGVVHLDVYGTQSLRLECSEWLDAHEAELSSPGPAGTEALAGMLHLADTLATVHLTTSAPVVEYGVLYRPTAGDSLTDFWLKLYDITDDSSYKIGSCEVCGKLFIGSSKNKRGHKACLNRQRVKLSRARKFAELVGSGISVHEASKRASISEKSARAVLKQTEGGAG